MAGPVPLRVGGAADGRGVHCRLATAAPGAMFAGGRLRTFGTERVDMVGGLGMMGGQLCDAALLGPAWLCSGSNLQYSTFRSLLQGRAGRDLRHGSCQWSVASGRWSVASGRWPGTAGAGAGWSGARSVGGARTRWHYFPVADARAGDALARWHSYRGALRGVSPAQGTAVIRSSQFELGEPRPHGRIVLARI